MLAEFLILFVSKQALYFKFGGRFLTVLVDMKEERSFGKRSWIFILWEVGPD